MRSSIVEQARMSRLRDSSGVKGSLTYDNKPNNINSKK